MVKVKCQRSLNKIKQKLYQFSIITKSINRALKHHHLFFISFYN
ncbi:hypothetical protein K661_02857 [Piscirickettsia salmonis LF-89 = ATCC VR-1361]|nr:hypothetical protein K661_02857 [Piscirickettsia salmonis LF-89 = ATCC VR-1361]